VNSKSHQETAGALSAMRGGNGGSRAGLNVRQWVPHLSVYLGHVEPAHTYWYLTATPELLSTAAEAFCQYAQGGQP
jgi:hypothetical protein